MSTFDFSLFESLKGDPVIDSSELLITRSDGLSVLGTKSILITDYPAVYIHDSGGLLGDEKGVAIESDFDQHVAFATDHRRKGDCIGITITIEVDRERHLVASVISSNDARANLLIEKLWTFAATFAPTRHEPLFTPIALPLAWTNRADPLASTETAAANDYAYLYVRKSNLYAAICAGAKIAATAVWPMKTARLQATEEAHLRIDGAPTWQGEASQKDVRGAKVEFLSVSKRNEFLTAAQVLARGEVDGGEGAVAAARAAPKGAEVDVDGPRFGGVRRLKTDFTGSELALKGGGQTIARIAFDDPRLRFSGTADRLVFFTPDLGPIGMQFGVGEHKRTAELLDKSGILAAAKRTTNDGPYPVLFSPSSPGRDIRSRDIHAAVAKVEAGTLSLTSMEGSQEFPLAELSMLRPTFKQGAWLEVRSGKETRTLAVAASPQVLEALHSDIRAESLALGPLDRLPAYLKAAAALEEDYFLDAIFGPCFELHAALISSEWTTKGVADLKRSLEIPKAEGADIEHQRLAALLAGGLDELRHHFERVTHMLPPLIRHLDERLVAGEGGTGPRWLKQQEAGLRQVLTVIGRASAEMAQLTAQAERISDFNPSRIKDGGTALAIGAGVLFSPLFLISAYSQKQSREHRRADMSEQALWMLNGLATRWNMFVTELVPMLSYSLTEALYPHRMVTAAHLGKMLSSETLSEERRVDGFRRVAKRLARLDVRRRYPVAPISDPAAVDGLTPLTRGAMIDHIRTLRDGLETHRFPTF